ncbi:MAG: exodeoxyribonuclease VII large subunit [candidate division Zixibacteria bacterium]|nr:exodeoxyribonuclease VII large subunit [candidate division Zixibacteria bacterium]
MIDSPQAYTVSAVTRMIKGALEDRFAGVWIEGEITGYIHHSSGHRYFSLKDEQAVLKATCWKSVGQTLKFTPTNGQKVLIFGDINVYEKGGNYQLNCKKIVPVGVGPLELAFRQLHERLSREGLFDSARKRPLPLFPERIGIVTSPTGAAIRDLIHIAQRRNNSIQLIIYPARVQGDGAENEIAAGIAFFNARLEVNLIIAGRGGGSLEDLWAFNTETVVRAIVGSRIPVVSAVGHEVDTTLSDLAADLRASTPSAAAELTVWSKQDFKDHLSSLKTSYRRFMEQKLNEFRESLNFLKSRSAWIRPLDFVNQKRQYLDSLSRVHSSAGKNRFELHKNRLSLAVSRLETLSPLKTLARGYSVSQRLDGDGGLIRTIADIEIGARMETIVADGRLQSVIERKQKSS